MSLRMERYLTSRDHEPRWRVVREPGRLYGSEVWSARSLLGAVWLYLRRAVGR